MKYTSLSLVLIAASASIAAKPLPVVDLGYVQQRATWYNSTTGIFAYKNIRYARPPIGEWRFQKPQLPLHEAAGTISDGSQYGSTICPQIATNATPSASGYSEDCLFLDVYSKGVHKPDDDVPVLVWIYGGGYTTGSKDDVYIVPTGLFRAADKPLIFVAINYRLGAFGWSAPPDEKTVAPNAGFHDAKAALGWVQEHIKKFGGNPADVTVFGQSAGGGIIMHLITAYGGLRDPPLFQKAILQSPGFEPMKGNLQGRARAFEAFMIRSNCSDLACLRHAPTRNLIEANAYVTLYGTGSTVGFGPIVDGDLVPDLPSKLLLEGRYHKTLDAIVAANNAHEGRYYVPSPVNVTEATLDDYLSSLVPNITEASRKEALALYLGSALKKESLWDRTTTLIGDIMFACNAQVLASSYATHNDATYRYIFAVPPGAHGDDVPFTFYSEGDNPSDVAVANTTVASVLPNVIASLAISGVPQTALNTTMETYRSKETVLVIHHNATSRHVGDPWRNERCIFWQNITYVQG